MTHKFSIERALLKLSVIATIQRKVGVSNAGIHLRNLAAQAADSCYAVSTPSDKEEAGQANDCGVPEEP